LGPRTGASTSSPGSAQAHTAVRTSCVVRASPHPAAADRMADVDFSEGRRRGSRGTGSWIAALVRQVSGTKEAKDDGSNSRGLGRACWICLDDDVEEGDLLLYHICDCKGGGVHRSCLEQLTNSNRRRHLPLEQRLTCDMCLHPYAVVHQTTFLEPTGPEAEPPVFRQPLYVRKQEVAMLIAWSFAYLVYIVNSFSGGRLTFVAIGGVLLLAIICMIHSSTRKHTVRLLLPTDPSVPATTDPLTLDDKAFYEQVFVTDRSVYEAQARAPGERAVPSARARMIIMISNDQIAGTHRLDHATITTERTRRAQPVNQRYAPLMPALWHHESGSISLSPSDLALTQVIQDKDSSPQSTLNSPAGLASELFLLSAGPPGLTHCVSAPLLGGATSSSRPRGAIPLSLSDSHSRHHRSVSLELAPVQGKKL